MELTIKQTNKILEYLKVLGFEVTTPTDSYGIEVIDEDYFNEKVNEALRG